MGQQGPLLVGEGAESFLQAQTQGMQGAIRRGDEAVQVGQAEEGGQQAETAGPLKVEDEEESQDETTQQVLSSSRAEESDELGVKPLGVVLA